ncbi:Ger(x)C family spore germination protein [Paenibacillus campinasensis]|uniref:Ger(X)C family spore germination protein n=1 Tax=Paenibacillus campinasensis TaxID=66347 RepID=A0A268EST7_9BACL|nr:Ger(x)C family spore germination protein [Paenibacillus campinasensis]PAD76151.1 hypothetical protein CHH67_12940 [Paenibacillus campinasensis]
MSQVKRACICILLVLFCLLGLCGCWDRKEINDVNIITAVGLDLNDQEDIELTVQFLVPQSSGRQSMSPSNGPSTSSVTASGITLADAVSKLQAKVPRLLFWGQTEILLFSEKFARRGIVEEMDYLLRNPDFRLTTFVYVSKNKPADVLGKSPRMETSTADILQKFASLHLKLSMTIKDLKSALHSKAGAFTLPMVELTGEQPSARRDTTAIFKSDRMVGQVGSATSQGILWMTDKLHEATINLKIEDYPGDISLRVFRSHTRLKPRYENGKWSMGIHIDCENDLIQNSTRLTTSNPQAAPLIENAAEQMLTNRLKETIQYAQQQQADIFGFADAFHRKYPHEFNRVKDEWETIFQNLEIDIHPKFVMRRIGMMRVPSKLSTEEGGE